MENIISGYVNGKYLYNKYREACSGSPVIKLSREYKYLFFKYLGYSDVEYFLEQGSIAEDKIEKQRKLLNAKATDSNFYYVCYYLGEDGQFNKGQIIIRNGWKTVEMEYLYKEDSGKIVAYHFFGNVVTKGNFAFFNTKFFAGNKKTEGAKFIFFVGKSTFEERHYLAGTYSGFDKYDRAVAGKMILKKYPSKSAMQSQATGQEFDMVIVQELTGNRIVVESLLIKNPLLFSKKSPYSRVLQHISGKYDFSFITTDKNHSLKLEIRKTHFNINSLVESIIIEQDRLSLVSQGRILYLDFCISGIFFLQKVSIYLKTNNFNLIENDIEGMFSGIDLNNNILAGKVLINRAV